MKVSICAIRRFEPDARVKYAGLELWNDDSEVFELVVPWESVPAFQPMLETGEHVDVPDWAMIPHELFDSSQVPA